jgi:hypothetical protein
MGNRIAILARKLFEDRPYSVDNPVFDDRKIAGFVLLQDEEEFSLNGQEASINFEIKTVFPSALIVENVIETPPGFIRLGRFRPIHEAKKRAAETTVTSGLIFL